MDKGVYCKIKRSKKKEVGPWCDFGRKAKPNVFAFFFSRELKI